MQFKMSRWHYWWAYAVIVALAVGAMWLSDRAYDVSAWVFWAIAIVFLVVCEVAIRWQRIVVTSSNLIIKSKVFKPMITKVGYQEFGKVSVRQTPLQQMVKMGDVTIHRPGQGDITLHAIAFPMKLKKLLLEHLRLAHAHHDHGGKK